MSDEDGRSHDRNRPLTAIAGEDEMAISQVDLQRVWNGISGELWGSQVSKVEHIAARLLRSPALARAVVTTPTLLVSWMLASAVVFAIGGLAMRMSEIPIVPLIAPILATIGVAFSYGAGADPAFELLRTTPTSSGMMLFVRVTAVLVVNSLLAIVAAIALPMAANLPALWFLPMVTMALVGLAVATITQSPSGGAGAGLGMWALVLGIGELRTQRFESMVSSEQLSMLAPLYLSLAAIAVGVIALSSSEVTHRGGIARW